MSGKRPLPQTDANPSLRAALLPLPGPKLLKTYSRGICLDLMSWVQ